MATGAGGISAPIPREMAPEAEPIAPSDPPKPLPREPIVLRELLSHLLRRAYFEAEARFAEAYKDLGVTSRQLALLVAIEATPGATQAALAESVGLDANTFSDLAKRSEKKGLIRRERASGDRRAITLHLTPAGADVIDRARPVTAAYQRSLTARLTEQEHALLADLLKRMLAY